MKQVLIDRENYILRFDSGEEVMAGLIEFANERSIDAAYFTVIGAAGEVVLSYYNLETKEYEDITIRENVEITSVIGNIGFMKNSPVVHAHGTFSRKDFSVIGGHIKKLVVSATCEVHLSALRGAVQRAYDEPTGLNLLQ